MNSSHYSFKILTLFLVIVLSQSLTQAAPRFLPAQPKNTIAPQLPEGQTSEIGEVKIEAEINRYGQVTSARSLSSTNQRLIAPSIEAIQQWSFKPATREGKAVPSTVIQPFEFSPGTISLTAKRNIFSSSPKAFKRVMPVLPNAHRNINGSVSFLVELNADGDILKITLNETSHEELVEPSKAALENWKFAPAIKNGSTVASTVLTPFRFVPNSKFRDATITRALSFDKLDSPPVAIQKHEPTLPITLEKEHGDAWLLIYIDENGYVAEADTLKTSNKALARLAEEAVYKWTFEPAIKNGFPVPSKMSVPFHFNSGLLLSEKPADRKPKAIHFQKPQLSSSMSKLDGYVRIVLKLDEKGNPTNAFAKQSSHPELEAPSIEAALKWKFKPAQRDGENITSTVLLPFNFRKS